MRPGVRHYNALIRALEMCGDWVDAYAVLEQMRQDGVEPDIVSYNTVVSALRRARQVDSMPKIFDLMEEMHKAKNRNPKPETRNPKPAAG